MNKDAKRAVLQAGAQLVDLAANLRLFAQLGLDPFDAEATMPNGAVHVVTIWAESWQAARRRAELHFAGAFKLTINGRGI